MLNKIVELLIAFMPLILSFVFIGIAYVKNKNLMRIDWATVKKVTLIVLLAKLVNIGIIDLQVHLGLVSKIQLLEGTQMPMPFWWFFMVFWEDGFYGLVIYYLMEVDKILPKFVKKIIIFGICFNFMLGHLYQGAIGMLAILYPFYISYKYGKKNGFGTVMICHILFDLISYMMYSFYVKVILWG
jgi:hypothetical protein